MFIANSTEELLPVLLVFAAFVAFTIIGCLLSTSGLSVLNRAGGRAIDAYWMGGAGTGVGVVLLGVALIAGAPAFWVVCALVPILMGVITLVTAFFHNKATSFA